MVVGPKVLLYGENGPADLSFGVRSFSNPKVRYDVNISLDSGDCDCGCMHFQCRLRKRKPTILDACKHVKAVVLEAEKRLMRRAA